MSTLTAKLGLTKPDPTENVDIAILNANYDAIDAAFSNFLTGAYKNKIRNGDMSVSQRGTGPWNSGAGYSLDGWLIFTVGGTYGVSRVVSPLGTQSGQNGAPAVLRAAPAGQAAAGDFACIVQRIEDVRTLSGKQVTVSFLANATSGTPKIGVEVIQSFGTGGAPSADVSTPAGAVTINTTSTKYSITFTIPSITGKTLGSNGGDYLELRFWFSAGTNFATRASGIGIQNNTFDITDVQLEAGAVATAFERLPFQVQLAWCQRYVVAFMNDSSGGDGSSIGTGYENSTTNGIMWATLPVTMRTRPTLINGLNLAGGPIEWARADASVRLPTGVSLDSSNSSRNIVLLSWSGMSTLVTGTPAFVRYADGTVPSGLLLVTAEL